jgi:hypothetical protein
MFLSAVITLAPHATSPAPQHVVVLYIGPEQILPLTSFFGAIAGLLLIFWNKVVGLFVRVKTLVSRK